jgi:hypothetical protein
MKKISFFIGAREIQLLHVATAVFVIAGILLLTWFVIRAEYRTTAYIDGSELRSEDEGTPCIPRLLDGVCLIEGEQETGYVAVMIENHVDARPQSGLVRASVVYEAPVEGNFSRFMALFPLSFDVSQIGPVRSARPYFLDWAREYGQPMYVHVGGSPAALTMLKTDTYFDFNEFYRGRYFWRSRDRYAPHNLYTSSELLREGWSDYGSSESVIPDESWKYAPVEPCVSDCVTRIVASFAPPVYQAEWRYVSSTEKYLRYQTNKSHVDHDGTQISADTVVVQMVETVVLDGEGRLDLETLGSGEARVFTKGTMVEGEWKKSDIDSKTKFYDTLGNEIPFTSGKIWIEVVNQTGSVEWE